MPELTSEAILKSLLYMLQETLEGPPGPGSAYLDQKTGLYDTLSGLRLEQVIDSPAPGRPCIAQHVRHVAFHINATIPWMRGAGEKRDWPSSWLIGEPNQQTWDALLSDLRLEHANLQAAIRDTVTTGEDGFGGAMSAIIHVAYHLGTIRQLALMQKTSF